MADSLDDIGSRIQHLNDLYELWNNGLDILERFEKHRPQYEERRRELEAATKLLLFHMQRDYVEPNPKL